jgi:U3 small nucleolar ribonucleoprotein protein IMP4
MLLTTSRKPSRKTRTLAKVLARFMNWRYLARGKMDIENILSFAEGEVALLEEVKGNPAFLRIIHPIKGELLSLRFNVGNIEKVKMDNSPVIFVGSQTLPFDPLLLGAIPPSDMKFKKIDSRKKVFVRRKDGWIIFDFRYEEKSVLRFKVKDEG